jgi:hypothetical protein
MSDRDGRKVAVYALNFGPCQKFAVAFGRPTEKREHRLYFVERIFDYDPLLRQFIRQNQEIRCTSCGTTYELEKLTALKLFDMQWPVCKTGICGVTNLSRKYQSLLDAVAPELLLPTTELGILQTLETEKRAMYAGDIASELDKSYQLVGKRGKTLAEPVSSNAGKITKVGEPLRSLSSLRRATFHQLPTTLLTSEWIQASPNPKIASKKLA